MVIILPQSAELRCGLLLSMDHGWTMHCTLVMYSPICLQQYMPMFLFKPFIWEYLFSFVDLFLFDFQAVRRCWKTLEPDDGYKDNGFVSTQKNFMIILSQYVFFLIFTFNTIFDDSESHLLFSIVGFFAQCTLLSCIPMTSATSQQFICGNW